MKLNLGCGANFFPGWVNVDREDMSEYLSALATVDETSLARWPEHQQKLAKHVKAGEVTCEIWDLRQGFPSIADNSVDAIYLGQIIEHLNVIYEAPSLMSHCMRVLRPGAPIRLTTPDLDLLIDAYRDGTLGRFATEQPEFYPKAVPSMQLSLLMFGASGPHCTWDHYEGHFATYSKESMHALLHGSGFVEIEFHCKSAEFDDAIDQGMSHSLAAEGRKPVE